MFIDSHCHLDRVDLAPYDHDLNAFLAASVEDKLDHMLCVSINWEDYPAMRNLVADQEKISISVGVHPNETEGYDPSEDDLIKAATVDGAVAIGETGLDYYRLGDADGDELVVQQKRFRTHMRAAKKLNRPVIVHTRSAKEDTLKLMQEEQAGEAGGVLHCFTEDWDMAKRALDMNFYISFSGIVTFKNAKQIQEVAKKVPMDRFLIETDSPYLAPVPMRGKINYPNYVRYVADKMAELRGTSVNAIAETSCKNYHDLFNRS
jgi:TatD DNase family protein